MELYMICVLMAIALSMVIFKGIQLVLSIIHPLPSKADIRWRQNPRLPMGHHENKIVKTKNKNKNKIKPKKEPKAKRLPRNVRLERLYAGSPASFDEFDTSFSRKSDFISDSYTRSPLRSVDDYIIRPPNPTNLMLLEQMSFAEEEEDPIEAYVVEQHQKMLEAHKNRSSTPIQSSMTRSPVSPYLKGHDTIV